MKIRKFVWAAACTLLVAGCGSGDGLARQSVSGTVTVVSKPLASGTINFQPAPDAPGTATPVATVIKDGAYSVSSSDGPVPGKYRVSISSPQPDPKRPAKPGRPADDGGEAAMTEAIPSQYNAQTTLTAEVTAGGKNAFDFPLEAGPAKP